MAVTADYIWAEDALPAAFLLLVVGGMDASDVVSAFTSSAIRHGDLDLPGVDGLWAETLELEPELDAPVTQIGSIGRWVIAFRPNGILDVQTVSALSVGGVAVAYYCSANADMQIVVAKNGTASRDFDPFLYQTGEAGEVPSTEESGLGFGDRDTPVNAAALALIERVTGLKLTRTTLIDEPRPVYLQS